MRAHGLESSGRRLSISRQLGTRDFRRVLATMHNLTNGQGYQDIELDFSGCTAALVRPLKYIAEKGSGAIIGAVALAALALLGGVTGLW
jgi:hypothetical protein